MRKLYVLLIALFVGLSIHAQTVLIDPAGSGGFENGASFSSNGWTVANASTDTWVIGNVPGVTNGSSAAYVSANGGISWTYSQTSTILHLYKEITIPAGEPKLTLNFKWKVGGEGSGTSDWDNIKVFLVPTSVAAPTQGAAISSIYQISGPGAVSGMYKLNSTNYNSEEVVAAVTPGITYRLVFSWKSDVSTIANPPAAIDEVSVVTSVPGTFTSIASGNWNAAATWDAGTVPSSPDQVIISSGHTVTINTTGLQANDVTVNGTLTYGSTPTSFSVLGNLTVNSGGVVQVYQSTTGKTLNVAGNITNNGVIDLSIGTSSTPLLVLNGSSAQTISGGGSFTSNNIRNLTFNNSSAAGITWNFNNINIGGTLTFTAGRVHLGSNKMTLGTGTASGTGAGAVGSLTYTSGGFTSGTFSRYWTSTSTGSAISAGSDPSNATSRYPFINSAGSNRAAYIERVTPTAGGQLSVTYVDASTTSSVAVTDGSYTIDTRYDGNWSISNEGTSIAAASYKIALIANGAYSATSGNSRVMLATSTVGGTHQNGTTTPGAQRTGLTLAQLTAGPLHLGASNADIPFITIATGNWEDGTTWNKGIAPTSADVVIIASGHTVTVNGAAANAGTLTINSGGTLAITGSTLTIAGASTTGIVNQGTVSINGGSLTIGPAGGGNRRFTNNGVLTVASGTMNVNGNLVIASGSTFNQSGGNINIDGNAAGVAANSVATGSYLLSINGSASTANLTGGMITFVDPHYSTDYTLYANVSSALNSSTGHTIRFGDGASSEAGGTNGFYIYTFGGSSYFILGNVIANGGAGTNRFVSSLSSVGVLGDLTVNAGSEYRISSTTYVAGNVINNGTLTTTSTLRLESFAGASASPSTNLQSISGSGVFRNLTSAPTANFNSLTINNTNAAGITLSFPVAISSTLTLTNGVVHTTETEILTLNSGASASATNGFVNGPVRRVFAASRNATGTYSSATLIPVGRGSTYLPIHIDPTTTSGGTVTFKAEAFTSNSGTMGTGVGSLSANRWEALITAGAGNFTSSNIRLNDAAIISTNKILQASSAAGSYENILPSSVYAAGPPASLTTTGSQILAADFTGYFAYGNPSCTSPTAPQAVPTATTASISWTASTSNPSGGYEWEVRTAGTAGSGATGLVASSATAAGITSANVTGLQPATAYTLYVRSNCGSEFSPWTAGVNFTTLCASITSFPYSEGFDASTLPSCWVTSAITGSTNWAPATSNDGVPAPRTGTRFAGKSYTNSDVLLISPAVDLSSLGSNQARINVWIYRNSDNHSTDRIRFHVNTSPNLTGATQILEIYPNRSVAPAVASNGWHNYTADIPISYNSGGLVYIIARGTTTQGLDSYGIGFDDFVIEQVPTTPCTAPADQATSLTFGTQGVTSQAGSFTAAASAPTGYLVVRSIGALNTNPVDGVSYATGNSLGNGTVIQSGASVSFTASGLTGNTGYTYTVFAYNNTACLGGPAYNTTSPLVNTVGTCPATPSSLSVPYKSESELRISWNAQRGGGYNALQYILEVSTENTFTSGMVAGSPFTLSDTTTNQNLMQHTVSGLNPATTYYYRVRQEGGCNIAFSSTASTSTSAFAHDDVSGAITLTHTPYSSTCSGTSYTTVGATLSGNASSCFSTSNDDDIWFKFVATDAKAILKVSNYAIAAGGGTTNTFYYGIYTGTPSALTEFDCELSNLITPALGGGEIVIRKPLVVGETYYIRAMASSTGTRVSFNLCVTTPDIAANTTANTCVTVNSVTINTANSNTNTWVPIYTSGGKLVAEINANGNTLGSITTKVYRNTNAVRIDNSGKPYLDRNVEITPTTQPTSPVSIRFYLTAAELTALQGTAGSNVSSINDLAVFKNSQVCASAVSHVANPMTTTGSVFESNYYVTANVTSFSSFYFASNSFSILPANLLSFSGARQGNSNLLKWTVAQEQDVQAYEVERSDDAGRTWNKAGSVNSLGNTTVQRSYHFTDNNIQGTKQLYRLRMVDRNGTSKLSGIVSINGVKPLALAVSGVFPNPAASKLNVLVDAPQKENITIEIMDAVGRVVKMQKATLETGANTIQLQVGGLAQGTYLLKVSSENHAESIMSKFIKE